MHVGSLYQFKRDEQPLDHDNDDALQDVTVYNSASFKYKSNLSSGLDSINTPAAGGNLAYRTYKNVSSFSRSLELSLINTKIHLELS